jgi:hypothetical protein
MKKLLIASVVLAAIGTGLGVTSTVHAQSAQPTPQAPAPSEHGMMKDGMSGMMGRMNRMMDACEKMMESKDRPEQKGDRG